MTSTPAAVGCSPSRWLSFGRSRDPVEEERIEENPVFPGEIGIDGIEGRAIIGAQIAWRQHAAQQHGDMALAQPPEHCVQRPAGHLGIDPAQRVIGAEFQDHRLGAVRNRPVEAGEPARGGVAGHPGIGDLGGDAPGGQGALQPDRKRLIGSEAVSGGERIPERHDPERTVGGARGRPGQRVRKHDSECDSGEPATYLHSGGESPI